MPRFKDILTASPAQLDKLFSNLEEETEQDFIKRIDRIAARVKLNHTQLVCGLGFNKNFYATGINKGIGFRSHKLLSYRRDELFSKDVYKELSIENTLNIYETNPKAEAKLELALIHARLAHIEAYIESDDADSTYQHLISYKMEINAIYHSKIGGKAFAGERLSQDISKYRHITNELKTIINLKYYPPSNLFFMDGLSLKEKADLIKDGHINKNMIKNRLQNRKIKRAERQLLEEYI